jgi:hypothetical protein
METPATPPLTIIIVEDNPVDVYTVQWMLTAHALPYTLHVIDPSDYALRKRALTLHHRWQPIVSEWATGHFYASACTTAGSALKEAVRLGRCACTRRGGPEEGMTSCGSRCWSCSGCA